MLYIRLYHSLPLAYVSSCWRIHRGIAARDQRRDRQKGNPRAHSPYSVLPLLCRWCSSEIASPHKAFTIPPHSPPILYYIHHVVSCWSPFGLPRTKSHTAIPSSWTGVENNKHTKRDESLHPLPRIETRILNFGLSLVSCVFSVLLPLGYCQTPPHYGRCWWLNKYIPCSWAGHCHYIYCTLNGYHRWLWCLVAVPIVLVWSVHWTISVRSLLLPESQEQRKDNNIRMRGIAIERSLAHTFGAFLIDHIVLNRIYVSILSSSRLRTC